MIVIPNAPCCGLGAVMGAVRVRYVSGTGAVWARHGGGMVVVDNGSLDSPPPKVASW